MLNLPKPPKRLKKSDIIGIVAPSGAARDERDGEIAVKFVENLGFRAVLGGNALKRRGYLAGSDAERAEDINEMFKNPEIAGIFALRGGYGAQRLLPLLDFDMIGQNPKFFAGYSDVTALLNVFAQKCGFATYHTPMVLEMARGITDFSMESFKSRVFGESGAFCLETPENGELKPLTGGMAEGVSVGGNLSLLASSIGTAYEPQTRGAVLFIEEVGEEPYRIDRMLTQLRLAGWFEGCAGIVFGSFTNCGENSDIYAVLDDIINPLKIPAICGAAFGHCENAVSFPIGARVKLNADKMEVLFL